MTGELFSTDPRVGPAHSARVSDTLITSPSLTQKASLVPILNNSRLVSYSNINRQGLVRMPAGIHIHYSQVIYRSGALK